MLEEQLREIANVYVKVFQLWIYALMIFTFFISFDEK